MATREEKEVAVQKYQFEVLLKKLQSEATLGRVRNLHPDKRHKLRDKLEKTYDGKFSEPPKQRKDPPEQLWKVYRDKEEKQRADKMRKVYRDKEEKQRADKMKRVRALAGK